MERTSLLEEFREPDRSVLRLALKKRAKERSRHETELVRKYNRLKQERHRSGQTQVKDLRRNKEFEGWCRAHGYSTTRFNRRAWETFIREWS